MLPKEEFKRQVNKHLTGREKEVWELLYFKVVELALETAALMLETDKSGGYSPEMICADFLAGDNLEAGNPQALKLAVQTGSGSRALSLSYPKRRRIRLEGKFYERLRQAVLQRDNWRCQRCGKSRETANPPHRTPEPSADRPRRKPHYSLLGMPPCSPHRRS